MTLWFVLALMTAAAVFAVLWPLRQGVRRTAGSDVEVYRDQLAEIDRDRAAGLIGEQESEAARVEVSRRLLAAVDQTEPVAAAGAAWRRRAAALSGLVLLPAGALALYLGIGSPRVPSQAESALRSAMEQTSIETMVTRVETYLAANPDDGRGWEVVGPVYLRLGRFQDAVKARRNVLRLLGPNAEREADFGEALTGAANGVVTAEAKAAFERALRHDKDDVRARYFIGLAAEQDGRTAEAAAAWRKLLDEAPADASWVDFVRQSLARVDPTAPAAKGPTSADVAAAGELTDQQRNDMVRGMVDRLAERLKRDTGDVDGWMMLVRSYMVMGERDNAQRAADNARRALAGEPDKLRSLEELASGYSLARAESDPKIAPAPRGPTAADIAAAGDLSEAQRSEMIRGMVDRLAERLTRESGDVEGWLRLVRSYVVMGDQGRAEQAARDARRALASEPDKLRRVDELVKGLGLKG
jgi:cytochrome c-type biogenesis protein CcmH